MQFKPKHGGAERTDKARRLFVVGVLLSFGGWVLETLASRIIHGTFGDRGFLTLPLCPIYGCSTVAVYLLAGVPERLHGLIGGRARLTRLWRRTVKNKKWRKYAFYFIFVTLLATAAELVTGVIAKALGVTLWDYSNQPLNLFGVICPAFSLLWGVFITLFMGIFWGRIYGAVCRIKRGMLFSMTLTLAIPIAVDFIVGAIYLIAFGEHI